MSRHLLIAVHLHADGMGTARYHGMHQGAPEWPPSPARVFQALAAGLACGQALPAEVVPALQWLEHLPPPLIAAPQRTLGQAVSLYVPNNDADALSNPADVSGIRTAKTVQPSLFDGAQPVLYAWPLPEDNGFEQALIASSESLYQLGRGVDMAWATAQVTTDDALHDLLRRHGATLHIPSPQMETGPTLPCPLPGSLDSLVQRHRASRLRSEGTGRDARTLFTNPPKPRFAAVRYATARRLVLYDLRERDTERPWPWPLHRAFALVEQIRDAAAQRLRSALPEAADAIQRSVVGKAVDGSGSVPIGQRVRIVPLPSIGSAHADPAIRRVLVEVPSGCPIDGPDLDWAFSGLSRVDADTGELSPWFLTAAEDVGMLDHYTAATCHWQSLTAVVLPEAAARRRIDPGRRREEAKPARERQAEEERAVAAVHHALRHAGVVARAVQVRVQREPFIGRGRRAESFAEATRFPKERMWHVAVQLDRAVRGPLSLGDGRFVGLGVMAPTAAAQGFEDDPAGSMGSDGDGLLAMEAADRTQSGADPLDLARAFRRAVMARASDVSGVRGGVPLNSYFSGHAVDSDAPDARSTRHLSYHWDPSRQRWLVIAPHRLERRAAWRWERDHLDLLDRAMEGMTELRAGTAGRHVVHRVQLAWNDPLLRPSRQWESVTPYAVTRHRRLASAADAVVADVMIECQRCRLPAPQVTVLSLRSESGQGLQARLRLRFEVAVAGPLALGRSALLGGGLFAAVDPRSAAT